MSLPVVHLTGSAHAQGVTHGNALKARIAHNLDVYFDRFRREVDLSRETVHQVAGCHAENIARMNPYYYAGMQGVAEGSGIDFLDIAALNVRYEILYYQFGQIAMAREASPDGCTAFAALPEATASGHLLMGQNWDWIPEVQGAVLHTMETDGFETLAFTEAGIVGAKIGLNSAGLGLAINGMTTVDDDWSRAVRPFHVRCYEIMRSRVFEDAVRIITNEPRACAGNFLIAQTPGKVLDVEAAPDTFGMQFCEDGCLTHANHFVNPAALDVVEAPSERREYSRNRQNRLRELLLAARPLTVEKIQETLKDTKEDPFGICRHRDYRVSREEHYTTVTGVVMDLDTRTLHLTDGPPDESPFQTVALG